MNRIDKTGWVFIAGLIVTMANESYAKRFVYDPACDCYNPDYSTPDVPNEPINTPKNPFALKGTGLDSATSLRGISAAVEVWHRQPDGQRERREFAYSTPRNFKNRSNKSVNLWLVFHGGGGHPGSMHDEFNIIPHTAPTVLVYPAALITDDSNRVVHTGKTKWRMVRRPGTEGEKSAYRDVAFINWLIAELLAHNHQFSPNNVYVSGFSSGAGMAWMMLCYRSTPIHGFGIYSQQLGAKRRDGGCADGQLPNGPDRRTGFEKLTGEQPDLYGYRFNGSASQHAGSKAVFYSHGTADDNLPRNGEYGCWEQGTCDIADDPALSMDPGGAFVSRDDISSVYWLLARHQFPRNPSEHVVIPTIFIPDLDKPSILTHSRDYRASPNDPTNPLQHNFGSPIRWYEVINAGHSLSAIPKRGGPEIPMHTQRFFEEYADMFK